jgi:hypothetical protein
VAEGGAAVITRTQGEEGASMSPPRDPQPATRGRRQNGPAMFDAGPFCYFSGLRSFACLSLWRRSLASTGITGAVQKEAPGSACGSMQGVLQVSSPVRR